MPVTKITYLKFVTAIVLCAATTTIYLWQKVEVNHQTGMLRAQRQAVSDLERERSRLTAAVVEKTKVGAIQRIAEKRLEMGFPKGRIAHLTVPRMVHYGL